jgi:hypothetical protein
MKFAVFRGIRGAFLGSAAFQDFTRHYKPAVQVKQHNLGELPASRGNWCVQLVLSVGLAELTDSRRIRKLTDRNGTGSSLKSSFWLRVGGIRMDCRALVKNWDFASRELPFLASVPSFCGRMPVGVLPD